MGTVRLFRLDPNKQGMDGNASSLEADPFMGSPPLTGSREDNPLLLLAIFPWPIAVGVCWWRPIRVGFQSLAIVVGICKRASYRKGKAHPKHYTAIQHLSSTCGNVPHMDESSTVQIQYSFKGRLSAWAEFTVIFGGLVPNQPSLVQIITSTQSCWNRTVPT